MVQEMVLEKTHAAAVAAMFKDDNVNVRLAVVKLLGSVWWRRQESGYSKCFFHKESPRERRSSTRGEDKRHAPGRFVDLAQRCDDLRLALHRVAVDLDDAAVAGHARLRAHGAGACEANHVRAARGAGARGVTPRRMVPVLPAVFVTPPQATAARIERRGNSSVARGAPVRDFHAEPRLGATQLDLHAPHLRMRMGAWPA